MGPWGTSSGPRGHMEGCALARPQAVGFAVSVGVIAPPSNGTEAAWNYGTALIEAEA